ncbi:MAG: glycosyltransferase family 4 protein [Candidatus Competibacteraceae bacterium]|nr:glycosyltransferase family 4 protein [Candidatus Competibacteraceae bacterium]
MRVAMFSSESLHSICLGGLGVHVTELSAGLRRRGHELHVITRRKDGQNDYDRIDGVHYHRVDHRASTDDFESMQRMCEAMIERFQRISAESGDFDIAHAHDWLTADALRAVMAVSGAPGVLTMHSTEYGRDGNVFHDGFARQVRDLEAAACHRADAVIAVSRFLADELRRIYRAPEANLHVVPNGVSYHAFDGPVDPAEVKGRHAIPPQAPTVFAPARMTAQKGLDLLVEAVPMLLAEHPQARIVLAGDGPERGTIERTVETLGIGRSTVLLGRLPYAHYLDLLRACDLVAVPSRNEPFGIVVLDAWSAGKPVVATTAGGPREFVRDGVDGVLVEADPSGLARGIGSLLADLEKSRLMGLNGRQAVEETFNWDRSAALTEAVYQAARR